MILFSVERKRKKILIIQSEDLARDRCVFKMKTVNNLNFIKFINLIKTDFNFNLNDENIIY